MAGTAKLEKKVFEDDRFYNQSISFKGARLKKFIRRSIETKLPISVIVNEYIDQIERDEA